MYTPPKSSAALRVCAAHVCACSQVQPGSMSSGAAPHLCLSFAYAPLAVDAPAKHGRRHGGGRQEHALN